MSRASATSGELGNRVDARVLAVALTEPQEQWLISSAARATPCLSPAERLSQILDEAIAASVVLQRSRAHQLEVYEASGYPEHHPDYPNAADNP